MKCKGGKNRPVVVELEVNSHGVDMTNQEKKMIDDLCELTGASINNVLNLVNLSKMNIDVICKFAFFIKRMPTIEELNQVSLHMNHFSKILTPR
jgi:hypothetical protein